MKALKFHTYLFFCIVPILVAGVFEGDQCETEKFTGKCLKIDDCNYAKILIRRNQRPQHCGFQNNTPLVCCPTSSVKAEDVSTNKTTDEKKASEKALNVSINKTTEGEKASEEEETKEPPKSKSGEQNGKVCCPTSEASISENIAGSISSNMCEKYAVEYQNFFPAGYGGVEADAIEFPHMALLGYGKETTWLCGGSLISEQFVLTAAHCTESSDYGQVNIVRLGELDVNATDDDASPEDFHIAEIFEHPDYRPPSHYNDIALLKLDRKVTFSEYITPACLYPLSEPPAYGLVQTGWGQTDSYGPTSSHLIKVYLDYIPHKQCAKRYEHISSRQLRQGIDAKTQTCAGAEDGRDACPGDSGGPLQVKSDILIGSQRLIAYFSVVGITSFGQACGFKDSIGIYTKVAPYISWVEEIVWPVCQCDRSP